MNAISLYQPWASAIPAGLKTIETRGWPAPHSAINRLIAICAAKRNTWEELGWWDFNVRPNPGYLAAFKRLGIASYEDLPRGKIVATALLVHCAPTDLPPPTHLRGGPHDPEWGDFSAGRFAWFLRDIQPIFPPVDVIGRQGLFTIPDATIAAAGVPRL